LEKQSEKTRKKQVKPLSKSSYKIYRAGLVLVFGNFAITASMLLVAFIYRTRFQEINISSATLAWCILSALLSAGVSTVFIFRISRERPFFQSIISNLEELNLQESSSEMAIRLEPFPCKTPMPAIARGWNQLVAILDQMQQQRQISQAQEGIGQFFCSYDSQRLLAVLDSLEDGIILADATDIITFANRACEGKVGRPLGELIGKSVLELFEAASALNILDSFIHQASHTSHTGFEIEVQSSKKTHAGDAADGNIPSRASPNENTTLWVACYKVNEIAKNSDLLLMIRDITQQKIREASRDDFIAHVSHELRSPLTNIRAYAETLLSDMILDASTQKEAFNVINEESARLTRLVNEVLDLTRMETGSLPMDKGEVIMDRLVQQCVNDVKASASGKKITLQTNYHPKLPNLYADREKLTVMINNILSNAIKYTPEGGTVFAETNVDERFVYIKISDTGYGIPEEDRERIFEKFYRVDREETANIPGTGLGLATCKEIANSHGGAIQVTSELNHGTEMLIKLPLTEVGPVLGPARNTHVE
jgi:signal transduction histidine kinase